MYVAYGRPGVQAGIDYWAGVFDGSSNLDQALAYFGTSPEFLSGFGNLSTEALIDGLYQQLFNRDADQAGRAWYADLITSGQSTLAMHRDGYRSRAKGTIKPSLRTKCSSPRV